MFRDKNFLIEKGMYANCRADTFFIIGSIYDEAIEKGINSQVVIDKIKELREYLDQHREIIDNKDYSISLTTSIIKRFEESFLDKEKKNVKEECLIKDHNEIQIKEYSFNDFLLYNKSIKKLSVEWENKRGVYGIFIDNKLVYIGSTYISFKKRFLAHKNSINEDELLYRELKKAIKENKKVRFLPLVIIEELDMKNKRTINEKELRCMELALITTFQPCYNILGVTKPFVF